MLSVAYTAPYLYVEHLKITEFTCSYMLYVVIVFNLAS